VAKIYTPTASLILLAWFEHIVSSLLVSLEETALPILVYNVYARVVIILAQIDLSLIMKVFAYLIV
jgi:hypothetical protein